MAVDASFKAAFPDTPVVWSYTSQIIRKKLAKQGKPVGGISDGLAALAKAGVKVVRVQSLHVMPGEEFTELERPCCWISRSTRAVLRPCTWPPPAGVAQGCLKRGQGRAC